MPDTRVHACLYFIPPSGIEFALYPPQVYNILFTPLRYIIYFILPSSVGIFNWIFKSCRLKIQINNEVSVEFKSDPLQIKWNIRFTTVNLIKLNILLIGFSILL